MKFRFPLVMLVLVALPLQAVSDELILPVFALNAENPNGTRRSTEIYLVNPTADPVQVSIAGFLPGTVRRPTPCGQFMSPTRVVPAQSAVLWTASGLATDLGCAEEALGALRLHAEGPVRVTGRMVRHQDVGESTPLGILSGGGQPVTALQVQRLPGPTTLLLPALLWHRNPCGTAAFTTEIGFANPGLEPVAVTLYLPEESRRAIRINGRPVALPHQIVIEPDRWTQIKLTPMDRLGEVCLEPESFDLEIVIDGPLAVYGSVVDEWSLDGRMVQPVDLELN